MTAAPISEMLFPADVVFCAATIIMSVCNVRFGPRIARAPKVFLWGFVIFVLAVRVSIWGAMILAPDKVHDANAGIAGSSAIFLATYFLHLLGATLAQKSKKMSWSFAEIRAALSRSR